MKHCAFLVLASVCVLLPSPTVLTQQAFSAMSAPEIPFEAADVLQLPPDLHLGLIVGVATNSERHVFVHTRTGTPRSAGGGGQLLEFAPDGTFIREIGKNSVAHGNAHSVRVDSNDNVWMVDDGSDMVVRFNPAGRATLWLGNRRLSQPRPMPPGAARPPARVAVFNRPTDVTWDPAGNIYVSDGYGNSRVAKFDKDGNWVKAWGEYGTEPGQFSTPHSIAADNDGNIYVSDRDNWRVQVFDTDGRYLREFTVNYIFPKDYVPPIPDSGRKPDGTYETRWPNTLCIPPGPNPKRLLYVSDIQPGRIWKMNLDGEILGHLGSSGKRIGQFGNIHGMACPSENELWVGEELNWRVQKLVLHPESSAAKNR